MSKDWWLFRQVLCPFSSWKYNTSSLTPVLACHRLADLHQLNYSQDTFSHKCVFWTTLECQWEHRQRNVSHWSCRRCFDRGATCVCLVCRVLLCRGCNPRLSRVRRSLNPRAEESAQSLSRPGSPRAARRGCGAGHQPGDCAAAGREGGKVRTAKLPGTVTQPASRPTGRAKNAKTAAKQSRKTVQIWSIVLSHLRLYSKKDSKSCSFDIMQSWDMSGRLLGHPGY